MLRNGLVARPRLVQRLHNGLSSSLTLLSASAGFGKTTLLGAALAAYPGTVAWLSLGASDSDPQRFLRYLVAAVQRVHPAIGTTLETLLGSPQPPTFEAALALLINELAALPDDLVLVLDDYHLIDSPTIHEGINFLLEHLPPQLHLVIATREDPPFPLARLRARGQLTELRNADLRATVEEATQFLIEGTRLPLQTGEIVSLIERTEGWFAGLQLVTLALRDADDPAAVLASLRGTHRYLLDYLLDEVLAQQSEENQQFLLQTSILERLSGALCDAVLDGSIAPPSSQQRLEWLERANLFVVALDEERRWYRYHTLFADLLHSRLVAAGADLTALYRRASRWFAEQATPGESALLAEAIRYALLGEAHEEGADLIEQVGPLLIGRGELRALQGWLDQLPAAVLAGRSRLLLGQAWIFNLTGQHTALEAPLQAAERIVADLDPSDPCAREQVAYVRGSAATLRAYAARHRGDIPAAIDSAREALDWLPTTELRTRTPTHLILGFSLFQADELADARHHLQQAITLGCASGNRYAALSAQALLGDLLTSQGQLHAAATLYQQAIVETQGPDGNTLPLAGDAHIGLGRLLHEWNDLPAAVTHFSQGLAHGEQTGNWWTTQAAATALAWTQHVQGNREGAAALLARIQQLALQKQDFVEMNLLLAQQARLWIAQGQLTEVAMWVQQSGLPLDRPPDPMQEPLYRVMARALIALGEPERALTLLQQMVQTATRAGRMGDHIVLLVLKSLAYQAAGNQPQAVTLLREALTLTEPEGYLRVFADEGPAMATLLQHVLTAPTRTEYARRVLHALSESARPLRPNREADRPGQAPAPDSPLVEPLSPREIELVRLLAAGLSNREIAEQLVITVGTVKWYLNHLYAKLAVRGRTQAIARARAMGFLP